MDLIGPAVGFLLYLSQLLFWSERTATSVGREGHSQAVEKDKVGKTPGKPDRADTLLQKKGSGLVKLAKALDE